MVAGPYPLDRAVQDASAVRDPQGRPVQAAAHQDVVDLSCDGGGDLTLADQRVGQLEGVSGVAGMDVLPGVLIAHAHPLGRPPPAPEQHAGRVRRGIEVAQHDDVGVTGADVVLEHPRGEQRLPLPFQLEGEGPARFVVRHHDGTHRGGELDHDRGAPRQRVTAAVADPQVDLGDDAMRPPGRQRAAHPVLGHAREVGEMVIGPEQPLDDLRRRDRDLLQGDHIGVKRADGLAHQSVTSLPVGVRGAVDVHRQHPKTRSWWARGINHAPDSDKQRQPPARDRANAHPSDTVVAVPQLPTYESPDVKNVAKLPVTAVTTRIAHSSRNTSTILPPAVSGLENDDETVSS